MGDTLVLWRVVTEEGCLYGSILGLPVFFFSYNVSYPLMDGTAGCLYLKEGVVCTVFLSLEAD
jgi:hypothetical protein